MIRFSKLLVGAAFLAIAFAGFSNSTANAATPLSNTGTAGAIPVGATPIVQPPLRPVSKFADWIQIQDLECGDEVDFGVTDLVHSDKLQELLGSLIVNYVMCPTIELMYNAIGLFMNAIIGPLLQIDPLYQNGQVTGTSKYLNVAWSVFRDLANIGLAFAVLLLVFSQATSYGLNAYGIKKLLPKIAIAAIMINLSYIFCAILIDVFNILGNSLGEWLTGAIQAAGQGDDLSVESLMSLAIQTIGQSLSTTGILAIASIFIVPAAFLVLLFLGLCAMLFAIARQVLVAFLVVVAPLAIAAWLFPNTERYFNRWWSTFIKLLALFPVVSTLQALTLVFLLVLSSLMI